MKPRTPLLVLFESSFWLVKQQVQVIFTIPSEQAERNHALCKLSCATLKGERTTNKRHSAVAMSCCTSQMDGQHLLLKDMHRLLLPT